MITITDYAAVFTAAASTVAAVFILLELRHMEKHRNLEISMKLFEWAETDRLRKAFWWVKKQFVFEDFEKHRAEMEEKLEASNYPDQVEAFFEEAGFLVNKKFVDIDVIADRLGADIISNWRKLEPWIHAIRKERGDATFGEHFQILYEKTLKQTKGKKVIN
jgi:hypothetical protein